MQPLLTNEEMRLADAYTIKKLGIPELILMEHASLAVVRKLEKRFAGFIQNSRGLILAGSGNNGGDALAVARLIHQLGCREIDVVFLGNKTKLSPASKIHFHVLSKLGVRVLTQLPKNLAPHEWIVDGIFGTGLSRTVEGKYKSTIETVNEASKGKWVVAIDRDVYQGL